MINCGQPEVGAGSAVIGDSYTVHSQVEYQCQKGFKPVGGDTERTCGLDGRWSGQPLVCKCK